MKCAIYARVSTTDQTCEMQLRELREYCARRGWEIAGEYVDTGWSGARASRPQYDRLMDDATHRRIDCIVVWKLDRWGRSVTNCLESLERLRRAGVRWIDLTNNLDTDQSNPTSALLLHILAAVAQFERSMMHERVMAGLKSYRDAYARGKVGSGKDRQSRSGKNRAVGRPPKVFRRDRAAELRAAGMSWRKIARELGVPQSTIRLALNGVQKPRK